MQNACRGKVDGCPCEGCEALRLENDGLRARIAELERRLGVLASSHGVQVREVRAGEDERTHDTELIRTIVDHCPLYLYVKDALGRYIIMNRGTLQIVGRAWEEVRGKTDYEFFPREQADGYAEEDWLVFTTGQIRERETLWKEPDGPRFHRTTKFPIRDARGAIYAVSSITVDLTAHKRAEEENRRLQGEIIQAQEALLRKLFTPLLPIARGIVAMPLIGEVDEARARSVLNVLLQGITAERASLAILDVTGVPEMDAAAAAALIQAARGARLLGAQLILTGIQPGAARIITTLGVAVTDVVVRGTLEDGIAYALARRGAMSRSASR